MINTRLILQRNFQHIFLPIFLLVLSIFNEKYYLSSDHDSLIPLYFIRILLFIFGILISFLIGNAIKRYRQLKKEKSAILNDKQKSFLFIFAWFVFWYGSWLIIYYPGSYTTDTIDAIWQFSHMRINDWFSYIHPLTYLFLYQICPKLIVIGIAQVLLCSFVYADIISYFYSKMNFNKKWKILVFLSFVMLFSSITSIIFYTFFYMRDIPYGVLHLYLAFYLYKICIDGGKNKISGIQLTIILSLGLLLSVYRGEGWIIIITALVCLLLYGKFSIRSFTKVFVFSIATFLFLNSILPSLLNIYLSSKDYYKLTLVAYPLGFILREGNNYISPNYEEDRAILSKVVDINGIQKYTNCYEIHEFQHGDKTWNQKATRDEWRDFYSRTYKIFMDNPHLFLAARTANFVSHLFVFKNRGERTNDGGRIELRYNECESNLESKWCKRFREMGMLDILKTIPLCHENNGVCGYHKLMKLDMVEMDWHWNSTVAFLLSFLVLLLYKFFPISAISSAVILCRLPLVFLTAPYAFFRYIFSLYLFGVFILFFVVLEFINRKKNNR